jgi:2,4-dienoyl-CoA reductase-like NADH-dependent reductase (Old Yellow Enzyme family)/NADPH-dependent 2,4-dienoyl-CoA reductase/sulfur reductase-like enzyme
MRKYSHVLSPIRVQNLVLKSRFVSGNSLPHFLQGPETFPSEQVINHMTNVARNGAAIVTFADWTNPDQRQSFNEDGKRFPMYDLSDPSVENYMCQLADQVHYYGSYISLSIMPFTAPDPMYDVYAVPAVELPKAVNSNNFRDGQVDYNFGVMMRGGKAAKELTHEMIHDIIETCAQRAKLYQSFGFDMVTLHFAYRATLFSRFISPITNKRTDEYGGSLENRARFLLELAGRIKQLCGKSFPIEVQITPEEPGGTTIEETIQLAKLCEGVVDIFQFRASNANLNHPTGYNSKLHEYSVLDACAQVKASGTTILCEPIGGFQNLDDAEEAIASGKADLIGGARAFFVDPDYYQKAKEGRGEDVLPCVRCNKCHVPSLTGHWNSICTVNPEIGIAHKLDKLTRPAGPAKRVAIVGGGPAGMRAALYCAQRGHTVTLYEASDRLGGQLKLMDAPSFKWPLVNYREYLIAQLKKSAVEVVLNTTVTKEMLAQEGFEVVIAALGASPSLPPVKGKERCKDIFETFGHEAAFGKRVVIIGGSESGTEAGLYLAENGHQVTVLTRQESVALDATPIHYRETIQEFYAQLDNFSFIPHATAAEVGDGYVEYLDAAGKTQRIECDSVVALGGMKAKQQEAMALADYGGDFYMIGDCRQVGNIHTGTRDAYAVTHQF